MADRLELNCIAAGEISIPRKVVEGGPLGIVEAATPDQPMGIARIAGAVAEEVPVVVCGLTEGISGGGCSLGVWLSIDNESNLVNASLYDSGTGNVVGVVGVALTTTDYGGSVVKVLVRPCGMSWPLAT
jgi:hypothetical protein